MKIKFLGGVEEIGANSSYINAAGTGIIIDAGLHPKSRDRGAFPAYELLESENVDYLLLTHAHSDHIGALPYAVKLFPHIRVAATRPTCDLTDIMIRDTARLLKSNIGEYFSTEVLSYYKKDILDKIPLILRGVKFTRKVNITGKYGDEKVTAKFYPSGHIIGAAGILIESGGKALFHSGDVNFTDQALIPAARFPKHHLDGLIIESTNIGDDPPPPFGQEKKALARYLNKITDNGGSVLIPCFSLGKTQEILKIIYDLMRSGKISKTPIYLGGLGSRINKVYDKYNYTVPRVEPGFKMSETGYMKIERRQLMKYDFFKEPSIVISTNGMMQKGTISHELAWEWFKRKKFGVAIVGWQDESSPGYALQRSEPDKEFEFTGKKAKRICGVEHFRFSLHSAQEGIMNFIAQVKPKKIFIVHGDADASQKLFEDIYLNFPQCTPIIPVQGNDYFL